MSKIWLAEHIPSGEIGTRQETDASSVKDLDLSTKPTLLEMKEDVGMARDECAQVSRVCVTKGLVCSRNRRKFHPVEDKEALKKSGEGSDLFIRRK